MTADSPRVHSHFDPDLRVSLEVPDDWEIASSDAFTLLLLAPEDEGFRANMGFSERPNEPATKDAFVAMIEQLKAEQARDFDDYELVAERRAEQDGRPAYLVRCRWDLEGTRVAQIAALYAVTQARVVEVHCTALAAREKAYLPLFQHVLGSLRFVA